MKNGGFAFPTEGPSAGQFENPGMLLRDWFASQATEEDVAHWTDIMVANKRGVTREEAKYLYADAMIEAQ